MNDSNEATRHSGTKTIRRPARRTARLRDRSSLRVWDQISRIPSRRKSSARMAIEPPQARFQGLLPRHWATAALRADAASVAALLVVGMNQRYPVVTPRFGTTKGWTRWLSQSRWTQISESAKARTSVSAGTRSTAYRRLWIFWLQDWESPATRTWSEGVRSSAQLASQRVKLPVGRVGFILDHEEQMVALVVLLEKRAEVGGEMAVDALAGDDQGRARPIERPLLPPELRRGVVIVVHGVIHDQQLCHERGAGYGPIPIHEPTIVKSRQNTSLFPPGEVHTFDDRRGRERGYHLFFDAFTPNT